MKLIKYLCLASALAFTSCTLDRTSPSDRIIAKPKGEMKEVVNITNSEHKVSVWAADGKLSRGYNEIRVKITDIKTNAPVTPTSVTFLPMMTMAGGHTHSCPHSFNLKYHQQNIAYEGYSVFSMPTSENGYWELIIDYNINGKSYQVKERVNILKQENANLNMTSFVGKDGERYFIALIAPEVPEVAKNKLIAGIYKYDKPINDGDNKNSYSIVDGYTLELDPRMPEPSMGNHSSPYNEDLVQKEDKFYHGVVNYTMTGDWTLNFILKDKNGNVIKGTKVPQEHTPGKYGIKSELHIDITF